MASGFIRADRSPAHRRRAATELSQRNYRLRPSEARAAHADRGAESAEPDRVAVTHHLTHQPAVRREANVETALPGSPATELEGKPVGRDAASDEVSGSPLVVCAEPKDYFGLRRLSAQMSRRRRDVQRAEAVAGVQDSAHGRLAPLRPRNRGGLADRRQEDDADEERENEMSHCYQ